MTKHTTTYDRDKDGRIKSITETVEREDGSRTSRTYKAEFGWFNPVYKGALISKSESTGGRTGKGKK